MISKARNGLSKEKFFTSESCCETYIDVVELFLGLDNDIAPGWMLNAFSKEGKGAESVPLFSMIYGKHSLLYGSICKLTDNKTTFEYKFARDILWGFIPSIEGFSMEEIENHKDFFDIIKNGVEFYHNNKEFLMYGRVVSPVELTCDKISLKWDFAPTFDLSYCGVIATKWETKDNDIKYVLYNCTDKQQKVTIDNQDYLIIPKEYKII